MQSALRPKYFNSPQHQQDRQRVEPLGKPTLDQMLNMVSTTMKQQYRIDEQLALIKFLSKIDRSDSSRNQSEDKQIISRVAPGRGSCKTHQNKENLLGVTALENHLLADSNTEDIEGVVHPSKLTLPLIVRNRNSRNSSQIPQAESQQKFREYEQLILQPSQRHIPSRCPLGHGSNTIELKPNGVVDMSSTCGLQLGNLNFVSAQDRQKQRKYARKLRTLSIPHKKTARPARVESLVEPQYQDVHLHNQQLRTLQPKSSQELPPLIIERIDWQGRSNSCSLQP